MYHLVSRVFIVCTMGFLGCHVHLSGPATEMQLYYVYGHKYFAMTFFLSY